MSASAVVKVVTNEELGIEAIVTDNGSGYSVALRDVDADEILPTVFRYKYTMRNEAFEKAHEVANVV